ncbi:MAG: ABC transporter ATP-binding protein [Thermodesulfobacteriota bacterium]
MISPKFIELKARHRHLFGMIRRNRKKFLVAGVCMLLVSATTSAMGYMLKPVIDKIFVNRDTTGLMLFPLLVIVIAVVRGVATYGQEYYLNYVAQDIIRRLRNDLYDHIQGLSLAFFQSEHTGALMSRITNDVNVIKTMVSTTITSALRDTSTIIGLAVVILYMNWRLAIIAFLILPIAYFPVFELGRRVRRISTVCHEAMADLSAFLHETLAGNKIVKAFGMEEHEKIRFYAKTDNLFTMEIRHVVIRTLSSPIMELLGGLAVAFVIWYGGWQVIQGISTPGKFISFLTCTLLLYDPVKKLSRLNNAVQQGLAAVDRIYDIIETPPAITDPEQPRKIVIQPHSLTFESVFFHYDGSPDKPVLRDIDLFIPPGQVLALVGMSGGGKSTLANLIPRFYDVSRGRILIDGVDIRELRVADLRRQIAIVTQEPILFNETVRDNIAYGNRLASEEELVAAAQAAYAHDFIMGFPHGYDTVIGEAGGRLSGGEKQRLCIARALLKDAPILILDEATSSLDSEAEALVQKALANLMRGRTTVVIAHRLATITAADQIAVLADGVLVEKGTHEQLLALEGEYSKLYRMQFSGNTAGESD